PGLLLNRSRRSTRNPRPNRRSRRLRRSNSSCRNSNSRQGSRRKPDSASRKRLAPIDRIHPTGTGRRATEAKRRRPANETAKHIVGDSSMTLSVTRWGRSLQSVGARTLGLLLAVSVVAPGCITGVPARRLPRELLGETRANTTPIDHLRLRQDPPP